jgi:hypothetical protein
VKIFRVVGKIIGGVAAVVLVIAGNLLSFAIALPALLIALTRRSRAVD